MIDLKDIELTGEYIAFEFENTVNSYGLFNENADSETIIIANNMHHSTSASDPRWATVLKIGPEVKDPGIVPGARVLVKELRWSFGIPVEGSDVKFHVTKECELLAVDEA